MTFGITKYDVWKFIRRLLLGAVSTAAGCGAFFLLIKYQHYTMDVVYGVFSLCLLWVAGFAVEQVFASRKSKEIKVNVDTTT